MKQQGNKNHVRLNVERHFPKDFNDLVKVAFEETSTKEKEEYQNWLDSLPRVEKTHFDEVIEGIMLKAKRKKLHSAAEYIREEKANSDFRYRQFLNAIEKPKKEPEFASDLNAIMRILEEGRVSNKLGPQNEVIPQNKAVQ